MENTSRRMNLNRTTVDFSYLLNYERFKLRVWREFRDNTGHWPVLSICFHYGGLVGMCVCVALFVWIPSKNHWGRGRTAAIGILGLLVYSVMMVVGESIMRKLDWRLYGKSMSEADARR